MTSATQDTEYSYDVEATDPDAGDFLTFSLEVSPIGMTIDPVSGLIEWTPGSDDVGDNAVSLQVTDVEGLFETQTFTLNVTDVNDIPVDILLDNTFVDENSPVATMVGVLSTIDPDGGNGHVYNMVDDAGGRFTIGGAAGDELVVADGSLLDFETVDVHNVIIGTTDTFGATFEKQLAITINDMNESPTDISLDNLSINENAANGSAVGTLNTVDPDAGDSYVYTMVDNAGGLFSIGGDGDQLIVEDGSVFDFETGIVNYQVTIQTADGLGLTVEKQFALTVNDVNESPTVTSSAVTNAVQGEYYSYDVDALDQDAGDTFSYSLDVAPAGMTINLVTGLIEWTPDNAAAAVGDNNVIVRVTDTGGLFATQSFIVTVSDIMDFETDTEGFIYVDDIFRSTNNQAYASGDYDPNGGFSGGGLHVTLGGVDSVDITNGMSGGWTKDFEVVGDDVVRITFSYRFIFGQYDADECGQVLAAVDGNLVSLDATDYFEEYCGQGSSNPPQDSGWQEVTIEMPLLTGTHSLTIGGWNNKKTYVEEVMDVYFDDIRIFQAGQAPSSETNCTDGGDNDGDGFIDCADPDCDGLSSCELGIELTCDDSIDNDGDGLADCQDADCDGLFGCELGIEFTCNDGVDNDGDGAVDCGDSDCGDSLSCESGPASCSDGIDNDGDGSIDCEDAGCHQQAGCEVPLFNSAFNLDSEGFVYSDDTFRGTANPTYASGDYDSSGGVSGGGLHVSLAGINNTNVINGMSGGWSKDFTVTADGIVEITLNYRLVFSGTYETDECGQALVSVGGNLISTGINDYLEQFCGIDGPETGMPPQDSGWQQVIIETVLPSGSHNLTLGGWNNKKTYNDEIMDVYFDEVTVVQKNSASDILFFDGFDDGVANGWTVIDESSRSSDWQVVNGKYSQLAVRTDAWSENYHLGSYAYYNNGLNVSDGEINVIAQSLADPADVRDSLGVMFRYQDNDNYYRFIMSKMQGFSRLEKKVGGVFSTLAFDGRGFTPGQIIDMRIVLSGSKIMVYVNGEPRFSVVDTDLGDGTLALFAQGPVEYDGVNVFGLSTAPRVVISQPASYSVEVTDDDLAPVDLLFSVVTENVPVTGGVKFVLDEGTADEASCIVYNEPYATDVCPVDTFSVFTEDHTVEAVIVDEFGDPLMDSENLDKDTNPGVATFGSIFVALGDSIANGAWDDLLNDNNSANGINLSRGYAPVLNDFLSAYLNHPVSVVNEGLGGTFAQDGLERLSSTLNVHQKAQYWIIQFGTNDAKAAIPFDSGVNCTEQNFLDGVPTCFGTFKYYMREMVVQLQGIGKVPILVQVPFANNQPTFVQDRIQDYNTAILDLADKRNLAVTPPDFHTHFQTYPLELYDDIHPNGIGYRSIATMLYNELIASGILP